MPPQQPQSPVGQYYLIEKIAQGGMAEIYKGLSYDVHGLKRTVCIKKILPHIAANREFIDALIDEAKIAVTLSHGNIAQTFDLGKVGDDYFIVMEFVDGRSLSQLARRAKARGEAIPIPILCYLCAEVLCGLDYMHRRTDDSGRPLNIVHRDVSPQNVMVSYSGTVKLIDFGIAMSTHKLGITESGILKGKFSYMSPEQARGDALDHRSDIFSLGIMLHEMLTGKRLFKADDSKETLRNVRESPIHPPSETRTDLPEEIDRIVMRALSRERRNRYAWASDMREDLLKFLHTAFPDFRPSQVAEYLRELFADELDRRDEHDDLKTPHLIMEGTQSALGTMSGTESTRVVKAFDMREYLLEEMPDRSSEPEKSSSSPPAEDTEHWKHLPMVIAAPEETSNTGTEEHTTIKLSQYLLRWKKPTMVAVSLVSMTIVGWWSWVNVLQPMFAHDTAPTNVAQPVLIVPSTTPEITTGKISITSTPSGAKIFLNDQDTGFVTPHVLTDIPVGNHSLGIYVPRYRFWKKELQIKARDDKEIDVTLALDVGALSITSSPEDALVLIDGTPAGQTPLKRENLEPDRIVHIEVWREGYRPETRDIRIHAGREEQLQVELTPEELSRP